MISSTSTTRRGFLAGMATLLSSAFLQLAGKHDILDAIGKPDPLAAKLANFHADKTSAKIVGQAYLRLVPSEAHQDLLVNCICSTNGAKRAELAQADEDKLVELLVLLQRDDFEHERVVKLQGWILSETECRLCALTALM